jgi:hypothetical protein
MHTISRTILDSLDKIYYYIFANRLLRSCSEICVLLCVHRRRTHKSTQENLHYAYFKKGIIS